MRASRLTIGKVSDSIPLSSTNPTKKNLYVKYCVYILQSLRTGEYYVGQTNNIKNRLLQHNRGYSKSTKNGVPWECKFIKEFSGRSEAMKYENKLKRMKSRKYLENLIEQSEQ